MLAEGKSIYIYLPSSFDRRCIESIAPANRPNQNLDSPFLALSYHRTATPHHTRPKHPSYSLILLFRRLLLLPLLEDAAVDERLNHKFTQWRGDGQSDSCPQRQRHPREREEARAEGGNLLLFEQLTW